MRETALDAILVNTSRLGWVVRERVKISLKIQPSTMRVYSKPKLPCIMWSEGDGTFLQPSRYAGHVQVGSSRVGVECWRW